MSHQVREAGGFVRNNAGDPDVYVHTDAVKALGLEIGDGVVYEIHDDHVVMRLGEKNALGFEDEE